MKVFCIFNMSMLVAVVVQSAACDTSVDVGNIPRARSLGDTTTEDTIPGFPNVKYPTPVDLSNGECPFETATHIVAWGSDPLTIGGGVQPPNMGILPIASDQLILHWTLCNDGGVPQPSGTIYKFSVNIQQTDSALPPRTRTTLLATVPPTELSLPLPPLPGCSCFVQEVGINTPVPEDGKQQKNIAGLGPADVLFPTVTLPHTQSATPNPSGNGQLTFQYIADISQFDVGVAPFQLL